MLSLLSRLNRELAAHHGIQRLCAWPDVYTLYIPGTFPSSETIKPLLSKLHLACQPPKKLFASYRANKACTKIRPSASHETSNMLLRLASRPLKTLTRLLPASRRFPHRREPHSLRRDACIGRIRYYTRKHAYSSSACQPTSYSPRIVTITTKLGACRRHWITQFPQSLNNCNLR